MKCSINVLTKSYSNSLIIMNFRLSYLDVLKAFAIILVVLYHFGNGLLPGGYLGVDLFFVINGFLLTRAIDRIDGFKDFVSFISRRLIRLYPVVIIAVLVCIIWGGVWLIPHSYRDLVQTSFSTLLFASNILSYIKISDYWAGINDFKPLMHTWYLSIIVQFYVVLPLTIILVQYVSKIVFQKRISVFCIICVCTVLSLTLNFLPGIDESLCFYFLPFRLYEFCAGYLVAHFYNRLQNQQDHITDSTREERKACSPGMPVLTTIRNLSGIALYALFFLYIYFVALELPRNVAVFVTVFLSCIFLLVLPYSNMRITSNRYIAIIGQASFSIYIWHQIVLAFYKSSWAYDLTFARILFISMLISGISVLSYRYIEMPVAAIAKNERHAKVLLISCVVSACVLLSVSYTLHLRNGVLRDVPELGIYVDGMVNTDHNKYNESAFRYNKDFSAADKIHWVVFGDSYARDWLNILSESGIEDEVELSYICTKVITNDITAKKAREADIIFYAISVHPEPHFIDDFNRSLEKYGIDKNKVYFTGSKRFGYSVNMVYSQRFCDNYPDKNFTVYLKDDVFEKNELMRSLCGEKFIDLYLPITMKRNQVRAFDDYGHILSQDSEHLTKFGARFYANYYHNLILKLVEQCQKARNE